jgi:hypothetical protein
MWPGYQVQDVLSLMLRPRGHIVRSLCIQVDSFSSLVDLACGWSGGSRCKNSRTYREMSSRPWWLWLLKWWPIESEWGTSSDMVEMFLESVHGIPFAFSHILEIASCTLYAINNVISSACDFCLSFVRPTSGCAGNMASGDQYRHVLGERHVWLGVEDCIQGPLSSLPSL